MERAVLKKGAAVSLINSQSGEKIELEIISDPLGEGESCIVYEAISNGDQLPCKYRLKELYPRNIGGIYRNGKNHLVIPDSCREEYLKAAKNFDKSLETLWEFAYSCDTSCYTVCPLGKFEGCPENGIPARYLITQWAPPDNMNAAIICAENDLYLAAKICLKTAAAVSEFHKKGYINFDIKPENILYCAKTETVSFFDMDTVFLKGNNENAPVLFSEGAAPEIANKFEKLYSEKADVFSIGSMLHRFITGQNYFSGQYMLGSRAGTEALLSQDILKHANPRAVALVIEIFRKCGAGNPKRRCGDDELISMLSKLVKAASPDEIYAQNSYIRPSAACDTDEFYSMRKIISKEHFIVIQGIKGSGKSEFALGFAVQAKQFYNTIIWSDYDGGIKKSISKINFGGIDDEEYDDKNKLFEIKFNELKKYGSDTLLIIDGYDEPDKFMDEFLGSVNIHILITSAFSTGFDKEHIYTIKSVAKATENQTEIDEFRKKMTSLKKINNFLRKLYSVLFCIATAGSAVSAAMYEFVSDAFGTAVIICAIAMIFLKSAAFGRAEKEAIFGISGKNCGRHFKKAIEFGNNANNHQIFEIFAPEFIPKSETKRHKFRIALGASAIFAGIIFTAVSFAINSFPFLVAVYSLIIALVFGADYAYSTHIIKNTYNLQFGETAGNKKRDLYEIYRFKNKSDAENSDEKLSPACMRQIIYNEYKTRCDFWGTADIISKFLAALTSVGIIMNAFSALPSEYFRIPDLLPQNMILHIFIVIFCVISCVSVAACGNFYRVTRDLLFTVYSDSGAFISEKFSEYSDESIISSVSYSRGIYNFAVIQFENGIPIYEIRKSERPTFSQYCSSQKARTVVYFQLTALAEFCFAVWHFNFYPAIIPVIAINIGFQIWWYFFGMYAFNKKLLGIENETIQ